MKKLKLALIVMAITQLAACTTDDGWEQPVIPLTLHGIETVNVDNSGEYPAVAASPVRKEAYMLGIKWIADHGVDPGDDMFITGPVEKGSGSYGNIANGYSKAVKCNTPFNASIPAGTYVSKFFKEMPRSYLPADVDEGFVLLVAPDAGVHSFTVEYYLDGELKFSHDTPLVELF